MSYSIEILYGYLEDEVALFIKKEKAFDSRMIIKNLEEKYGLPNLSLTEVGVHLKKMFNGGKMPGYTLMHKETSTGLSTIYYHEVTFAEQVRRLLSGKL